MTNVSFGRSGTGENVVATLPGAWELAQRIPYGTRILSRLVGRLARYTGSIGANIVELAPGRSTVVLEDRPAVRNHLRCIHAVALANLAELAGNTALAFSMPSDARFIVAGLSIDYEKKARGRITAVGTCPPITSNERAEYAVHVTMRDAAGETVATSVLRTLVGPRR